MIQLYYFIISYSAQLTAKYHSLAARKNNYKKRIIAQIIFYSN